MPVTIIHQLLLEIVPINSLMVMTYCLYVKVKMNYQTTNSINVYFENML